MFVIITYDVGEKRVNKVCKKLRQYFFWSQNSVFEGEISEGKLQKCLSEIKRLINKDEDSIYVYKIKQPQNIEKIVLGQMKNTSDSII